ncbi:hypothetical protein [Kingella potus]|nr:hypothetical protein [Kingella potus]UOP01483.1 hypothetical protein LVJ84_04635 [Kingella potus]
MRIGENGRPSENTVSRVFRRPLSGGKVCIFVGNASSSFVLMPLYR